jgi:hypothetical protein
MKSTFNQAKMLKGNAVESPVIPSVARLTHVVFFTPKVLTGGKFRLLYVIARLSRREFRFNL